MVLIRKIDEPDGESVPYAVRSLIERLPASQHADVYLVHKHEQKLGGSRFNRMTDWLQQLQRAREHGWLASMPPEKQRQLASLPAEDRFLRTEMHHVSESILSPKDLQTWERWEWNAKLEWLATQWVRESLDDAERSLFDGMNERSKLPFLRPLPQPNCRVSAHCPHLQA